MGGGGSLDRSGKERMCRYGMCRYGMYVEMRGKRLQEFLYARIR